ncbi:hypothetical protein BJX70DRAFT_410871 [Aspergillus crustosus]
MIRDSGIDWFDDDDYVGAKFSFPSGSVWKIDSKISEHEYYETQADVEECGIDCEARGSFLCSNVSGPGPSTAVIKIRLQIPWWKTAYKKPAVRARQARSGPTFSFQREIEALDLLEKARCSCVPYLLGSKEEEQTQEEWVPGGYKLILLMKQVPGHDPSKTWNKMPRAERDDLRAAFKESWLETMSCGMQHMDPSLNNLIWDKEGNKCYLIDWERWSAPLEDGIWKNTLFLRWNLAHRMGSRDRENMATWTM